MYEMCKIFEKEFQSRHIQTCPLVFQKSRRPGPVQWLSRSPGPGQEDMSFPRKSSCCLCPEVMSLQLCLCFLFGFLRKRSPWVEFVHSTADLCIEGRVYSTVQDTHEDDDGQVTMLCQVPIFVYYRHKDLKAGMQCNGVPNRVRAHQGTG